MTVGAPRVTDVMVELNNRGAAGSRMLLASYGPTAVAEGSQVRL